MPIYTYTTFDDPSSPNVTNALGINSAGQIVGYYHNNGGYHGFLLSSGTYTPLDDPSATGGTFAYGINAAGQIVGYYNNASGFHGFLLSGGAENQSILIRIFNSLDNRSTTYGCSILTLQLF